MQHPPKVEHYKSDIEDQEYQIKRYQRFNLKPNRENVGSVSKSRDGAFTEPFLARFVSDGTIKILAYLVLLHDPKPRPLLCVEEPENQLYPSMLATLGEEFRDYARRAGQVFVSTHSPDLLNAAKLDEVFLLVKKGGYTEVRRAYDDEQLRAYMEDGDQMGHLWKQGLFEGVDPCL